MYSKQSIAKYLNDLAAKSPAPGGGSSAALSGAMAAALICMVLNYTIGKKKYKAFEPAAKKMLKQAQASMRKFLKLFEADIKSYDAVARARGNSALRCGLKKAMAVPLEIQKEAALLIKACPALKKHANKNLVCDIEVARQLLRAAFYAAKVNVDVNRKAISKLKRRQDQN